MRCFAPVTMFAVLVLYSCSTGPDRLQALLALGPSGRTDPTRIVMYHPSSALETPSDIKSMVAASKAERDAGKPRVESTLTELALTLRALGTIPIEKRSQQNASGQSVQDTDAPGSLRQRLLAYCRDNVRIEARQFAYDSFDGGRLWLTDYYIDGKLLGTEYAPYTYDDPEIESMRGRGPGDAAPWLWYNYALLPVDLGVSIVIGVKECGFEIAKAPLTLVEFAFVSPFSEQYGLAAPFEACYEDAHNAMTALTWRFRSTRPPTLATALRDLVGAVPLVGPGIGSLAAPSRHGSLQEPKLAAISNGIYTPDGKSAAENWRLNTELSTGIKSIVTPYDYGGIFDVAFSMLNLSSGFGYELASQVERHVQRGEVVTLSGFSGGVQRSVAASRALEQAGITADRLLGVSGPTRQPGVAGNETLLMSDDGKDWAVVVAVVLEWLIPVALPRSLAFEWVHNGGAHGIPFGDTLGPYELAVIEFWKRN